VLERMKLIEVVRSRYEQQAEKMGSERDAAREDAAEAVRAG